ncbi:hypothetical protein KAW38_04135 [Candidatus Micrarchaeota archaeon]|nr:hypothetical protein [Candidatus Micrarchaeota archaeon]
MKVEILSEKENGLLNRREIDVVLDYRGATPKKEEIRKAIVEKLGVNPEAMAVIKTRGEYGMNKIKARVHAYKTKENLLEVEEKYILMRNKLIEEKGEEKPKEEPKKEEKKEVKEEKAEEKPSEKEKEEPVKEEKKEEKKEPEKEEKPKEEPKKEEKKEKQEEKKE